MNPEVVLLLASIAFFIFIIVLHRILEGRYQRWLDTLSPEDRSSEIQRRNQAFLDSLYYNEDEM